jgi:AcrR family transcriptional regulator
MVISQRSTAIEPSSDRHRGGRRLDLSRDDELRNAALGLLAEIGYERLTMDAIAASAGAGKATLYRRWSGKAELVLDAIVCAKSHVTRPDTGSLHGDLTEMFEHAADNDSEFDAQVMVGLVGAMARDEELREAFQERMIAPLLSVLMEVFEAAIARGEIAPVDDLEFVVSVVPAFMLYRHVVFGDAFSPSTLASIVDNVLMPLVTLTPSPSTSRSSRKKPLREETNVHD